MAQIGERDRVLDVLRAARPRARELGVTFVGIVGSMARDDARQDSDIDLVFDAVAEGHLWPLLGLVADIEDALGRRIDLIDRAMMPADSWAWMARDLVPL
ncbi:MAG: nucleotidyltransferase domain-containing protein [Alphaproteobacteria bacterium]|nr:nucleotidyltransferase domain-containing protein [Alphaproteobacteria bacterium]MBU2379793.1 nucleotidyltransferase domain-containing protein [Alphaproteobacteria bacterium]